MNEFVRLGVSEERMERLQEIGITKPTPVQRETIPIVYEGRDVISQAQTGTGKTLAFVLPMLDRIQIDEPYVQGLILTPTRELALQITAEVKKLTEHTPIKVLAVYGGQDVLAQLHKLKGSQHIIVATPGRLLDHLRRETISLSHIKMLVLDEADQMLHMGFLTEVEDVLRQTSGTKQTMLFSATMPPTIRELASRLLQDPAEVTIQAERVTVRGIRQWVVETTDRRKQESLVNLLYVTQPYLAMIFCRTKRRAKTLNEALQQRGFASDELHGDLSQSKREQVMKRFREAELQLLVATDVAARGLDVEGVTHVFNYDVPLDTESYIHRIGRTGRAGESGLAIMLIADKDRRMLAEIERGIGMSLERRTEEGRRQEANAAKKSSGGGGQRDGGGKEPHRKKDDGKTKTGSASSRRSDRAGREKTKQRTSTTSRSRSSRKSSTARGSGANRAQTKHGRNAQRAGRSTRSSNKRGR